MDAAGVAALAASLDYTIAETQSALFRRHGPTGTRAAADGVLAAAARGKAVAQGSAHALALPRGPSARGKAVYEAAAGLLAADELGRGAAPSAGALPEFLLKREEETKRSVSDARREVRTGPLPPPPPPSSCVSGSAITASARATPFPLTTLFPRYRSRG